MEDDYIDEVDCSCPKCGHFPLRGRDCDQLDCNDGFYDLSEEDPINFAPGESYAECEECKGTGYVIWCPQCGADLTGIKLECDEREY